MLKVIGTILPCVLCSCLCFCVQAISALGPLRKVEVARSLKPSMSGETMDFGLNSSPLQEARSILHIDSGLPSFGPPKGIEARSSLNLLKRGLDPRIDLNAFPPEYEQFYSQDKGQPASATERTPTAVPVQRKEKKKKLSPEEKRRRQVIAVTASRYRLKERLKEALKDPSKMTPELQKSFDKLKATSRRGANRYYSRLSEKMKNNEPLTPAEHRRIQAGNRTKEWRNANPKNQRNIMLERRILLGLILLLILICSLCFEKRDVDAKCATDYLHSTLGLLPPTVLRKRGESFKLDLNLPPATEEGVDAPQSGQVGSRLASEQEKGDTVSQQVAPQLAEHDSNPFARMGRRPKTMSPEERRKSKIERSSFLRRQRSAMYKEACCCENIYEFFQSIIDPSKMTPKLQRWAEKYKATNRRTSLKAYHKMKFKAENNLPLTEKEYMRLQASRKSKEWRESNPENRAKYEKHLRQNRERRKLNRDRKAANEQQGLQKRAFDLNRTPEPESESSASHHTDEEGPSRKRKDPSRLEDSGAPKKRLRSDPKVETIRQKWKEAQEDPSKMTPQIQKSIDRYERKKLSSRRAHAALMEKVRKGEELSPQQKKRYGSLYRTKEWRESSETNKARYWMKRNKAQSVENPDSEQAISSFKRKRLRVPGKTAEQKKESKRVINRMYYRQRMDRYKAARNDPSKMTPELREEMKEYYRKNNESTKRYHERERKKARGGK
ncbi:uncharacterized protein FA14DRAFT_183872 [Meira miltonrushii]|uniref:HMG box domain-containing protein n=1 Tax=Meira miltonrushii TaxID=1280837 RepID=A0A316VQS8_9BASI|nr:uncharacterized protein FA14DRAFT_183872 [Meira miltonrushii]PWN38521.1 hypothetical protein FA14DRAFT_183872 [Meira miltonrushii]